MRATIIISTLSEAGVIYVMTHDSIGLGEYGPTHQPMEHLASFRAMPNVLMLCPGDGKETTGAYKVVVLNRKRPSILSLSRQVFFHRHGVPKGNGIAVLFGKAKEEEDVLLDMKCQGQTFTRKIHVKLS